MVIFGIFLDCFIVIFCNLCGKGKLILVDIDGMVWEICCVLFDVDVVFEVVKEFIGCVCEWVFGDEVNKVFNLV